ncbi:hypothetical protein ACFVT6_30255 [Streptomyces sp. NPDC058049]|uniref:hypothetical protein n=1 Tax=Streptomyces sp. NPDC058049 TaxID=3346314 RepID=UPI0036EE5CF4
MTRTTPPRPLDAATVFPELADLARTATRLHPRPGSPTVHDSSVGGPLLWPADEPWASCSQEHDAPFPLNTPEEVRTLRRIRARDVWTAEERAEVSRIDAGHDPALLPEGPHPLIPVAQLYARDVPGLPFPEGTDLLQVLWCPFIDIEDPEDGPGQAVQLRWRRADAVEAVLAAAPEPEYVGTDELVPVPCVLHPEQVREYPAAHDLDRELAERISRWEEDGAPDYRDALSVAAGWKAGGWAAPFTFRDSGGPKELRCRECAAVGEPLLTLDHSEWNPATVSWRPFEEPHDASAVPTGVTVGRGYTLQFYACPADPRHPPVTVMQ